jgi:flagellar basal-body rod protein FlgG
MNPVDSATPSAAATEPGRITPYAPPMEARTNYDNGPLTRTGNSLDVAIVGKGFFEIQTPDGSRFTRKGNFTVNADGVLATAEGWPVLGEGGEIAIDEGVVEIGDQGEVFVDGDSVAMIRVVDFPEPYNLVKTGDTLFMPAPGIQSQPVEEGDSQVAQGYVEASNVDAIRTMTEMIETLRVFEAYQRMIRTADEATAKTVNEVGRSA